MISRSIRYHYTVGFWARLIVEDGLIQLATLHVHSSEKPAVWFSVNPTWESRRIGRTRVCREAPTSAAESFA